MSVFEVYERLMNMLLDDLSGFEEFEDNHLVMFLVTFTF